MTRPLLLLCLMTFFGKIIAQCPAILTDDPIEVCSSGGTKANIVVEGTILTAKWSPAIGLDNANILNPTFIAPIDTTYLLTITGIDAETQDTCEVQKIMEIKVTVFDLVVTQDTVNLPCGDTIRLAATVVPNGSYFITEWETDDGHFTLGNQTLIPSVDAVGQYNVNVIGNLGRIVCRDKDSLQVVLQTDNPLEIEMPESLHCNQNSVILTLGNQINPSDYLYNWTTTNGQFIATTNQFTTVVNQPGLYEVSRTNLLGACRTKTTVEVKKIAEFDDFSLDLIEPSCESPTGAIVGTNFKGGQSPFQYSIDNGVTFQTSSVFEGLTATNYSILIVDANGCKFTKVANFAPFKSFDLSIIPFQEVEKGTTFQFPLTIADNGAIIESFDWWPNVGLSCTDCPQPILTEFKNRRYEVTVVDAAGCEKKAKIEIGIRQPNLYYGPTIFSPNGDGQNDEFSILLNNKFVKQLQKFSIFDRYGNLIFQSHEGTINGNLAAWDGRYKGEKMPIGTYLYSGALELLDGEIERFSGTLNLVR